MSNLKDFKNKNTEFTGTKGIDLPEGTEAQRVDEAGVLRFNTDTNLAEYYTGTEWKTIDTPPTITSVSVGGRTGTISSSSQYVNSNESLVDSTNTQTIVISGTLFDTAVGAVVTVLGTGGGNVTPISTTVNSSTQITITANRTNFSESFDPYTIRVTNPSGLFAEATGIIDVQAVPVFSIGSGTLASPFQNSVASIPTPSATDADGDTITYSIVSGSLPTGLSLDSSTAAITGTPTTIQLSNFRLQAATSKGTVVRDYAINVIANPFIVATGGTITESGDFRIHTFTSPSNFVVTNAGAPTGSNSVEYLIVAGGGSGGVGCGSGGGGAGGYRTNYPAPGPTGGTPVSATTYPISVGGGASGVTAQNTPAAGAQGSSSSAFSITSAGGGLGAGNSGTPPTGGSGGSGGGGGHGLGPGGSGNTPPVSPPQGNSGGQSVPQGYTGDDQGGGGGGASQAGIGPNGFGGAGSPNSISGSAITYAGGGGGGHRDIPNSNLFAPGGTGGGGTGGSGNSPYSSARASGTAGTPGLGGGGGGACRYGPYPPPPGFGGGGNGGSGIVIVRYKYQ
jgi:hypothetical protein